MITSPQEINFISIQFNSHLENLNLNYYIFFAFIICSKKLVSLDNDIVLCVDVKPHPPEEVACIETSQIKDIQFPRPGFQLICGHLHSPTYLTVLYLLVLLLPKHKPLQLMHDQLMAFFPKGDVLSETPLQRLAH